MTERERLRARRWFLVLSLTAVFAGLARYKVEAGWTPKKVERMIRTSLPPGTTRPAVEAWLDAQGISRSAIIGSDGTPARSLMAEIPDANVDLIWSGELQIYFH